MKHFLTVLTFMILGYSYTQDFILDNNPAVNQSFVTCSGFFYDSGGDGSPLDITAFYLDNESDTVTFCPDQAGKLIYFVVQDYRIQQGDQLKVFDGDNASATQLGNYSSSSNGYDLSPGDTVRATTSNSTGCLTFVFESDNDTKTDQGWKFEIGCFFPCQDIIATATFNGLTVGQRNGPIKICRDDIVDLRGFGIYPDINTPAELYGQENQFSSFSWIITPGNPENNPPNATVTGWNAITDSSEAFVQFIDSGIYHIKLDIKDTNSFLECLNQNYINQVVWVSGDPVFDPLSQLTVGTRPLTDTICLGDIDTLVAFIDPFKHIDDCTPAAGEVTFIPDGQDTGSGLTYDSEAEYKCYPIDVNQPGSGIINNATDIQSICVNLEHSAIGDLEMTLTCPSGQSVRFLTQLFGENSNLGTPIDVPGSTTQGVLDLYCFDMVATSTLLDVAVTLNTVQSVPTGNYRPIDDFTNFVGCEINGKWKLSVKDAFINDNGYIGDWQITFDPAIQPTFGNSFENTYLDSTWAESPLNKPGGSIISNINKTDSLFIQPKDTGRYCYQLSVLDDFGCTYDTTICVVVLPRDTADFEYSKALFCINETGESPTFIDGGKAGDFEISPATGLVLDTVTGRFTINATTTPGTYTITNTVFNAQKKCPDVHTFDVTIVDTIKPNITAILSYCELDTAIITNAASFDTVEWFFAGVPSGNMNDTAFVTEANNAFSARAVDANGCITFSDALNTVALNDVEIRDTIRLCAGDSAMIFGQFRHIAGPYTQTNGVGVCDTVFITELIYYPSVSLGTDQPICFGNSAVLTAAGVDGPATYTWNNNFLGTSQTVQPVTDTEFSVIAVDVHGCVTMDTMMVTVSPVLDGTVTYSSTTFCPGSPNVLPATMATGGGLFTSSPAGFVDPVSGEVFVSTMAPGSYTVSYNLQPFNPCNIPTDLTFIITDQFDGGLFYSPSIICTNAGQAAPIFTGTGAGVMTVNPAFGLSMHPNTGVIDPSASNPGTYDITNSPAAGCPGVPGTTTITIVDPTPVSASASPVVICQNEPVTLTANPSGLVSYSWDNGAGSGDVVTAFPQSSTTFTMTAQDANGCFSTAQTTVFVNPLPILDADANPAAVCAGEDITLTGTLVNKGAFNPADQIAFSWSPSANLSNPTQTTAAVVGSTTTIYSGSTSTVVTLTATNLATGCTSSVNPSLTLTVNPLPVLTANAAPGTTVCEGTPVTLSGSSSIPNSTFQWNNSVTNGVPFNPSVGTTTYTGVAFSPAGCQSLPQTVSITVNPNPVVTIAGNTNQLCEGSAPEVLTASGAVSYVWSTTETGPSITVQPVIGGPTVSVIGTDANGCVSASTSFTFDVIANNVNADIIANPTTGYPNTEVNFTNGSTGADNFVWQFGNGAPNVTTTDLSGQTMLYGDTAVYYAILTATNTTNGCFDIDTVAIVIRPFDGAIIYIPNIFTPNGDNTNDTWTIDVTNDMGKEIEIVVYNRWGNPLKEIKDFKDAWDGTDNGDPASEGVYFFTYRVVGFDDKAIEGHGNVTLIRK